MTRPEPDEVPVELKHCMFVVLDDESRVLLGNPAVRSENGTNNTECQTVLNFLCVFVDFVAFLRLQSLARF